MTDKDALDVEQTSITERIGLDAYPHRFLFGSVIALLTIGAFFYHFVEGWNMLDSLYFCAITLATIGYGDFSPKTDLGKLFTIGYAFAGLSVFAAFIQITGRNRLERRYERGRQKVQQAQAVRGEASEGNGEQGEN
jgi:hypothetical protein